MKEYIKHECNSFSDGSQKPNVKDSCVVPVEFGGKNFQPSFDGLYNLKVLNDASTLDLSQVRKLRIDMKGNYILYQRKKGRFPFFRNLAF